MVDFPSGVSATDPSFLLGANATDPAKAVVGATGLEMIAAPDALTGRTALGLTDPVGTGIASLPAAAAMGPNDLVPVSQSGNTLAAKAKGMLPTSEVVNGTGTISAQNGGTDYIIIGTGTAFLTEVQPGDILSYTSNQSTVLQVISDTELRLSTWVNPAANSAFTISRACARSFTTTTRFVSIGAGGGTCLVSEDRSNPVIETLSLNTSQSRSNIRATCVEAPNPASSATSPTQQAFGSNILGVRFSTWVCWANGAHGWGPGTATRDVFLGRSTTPKELEVGADVVPGLGSTDGGTGITFIRGAQKRRSTGTNAVIGEATLVGGTVTVNTTAVTANSSVLLTRQTSGGTVGHLSVTKNAGNSITITSSSATETSTVAWEIVERG